MADSKPANTQPSNPTADDNSQYDDIRKQFITPDGRTFIGSIQSGNLINTESGFCNWFGFTNGQGHPTSLYRVDKDEPRYKEGLTLFLPHVKTQFQAQHIKRAPNNTDYITWEGNTVEAIGKVLHQPTQYDGFNKDVDKEVADAREHKRSPDLSKIPSLHNQAKRTETAAAIQAKTGNPFSVPDVPHSGEIAPGEATCEVYSLLAVHYCDAAGIKVFNVVGAENKFTMQRNEKTHKNELIYTNPDNGVYHMYAVSFAGNVIDLSSSVSEGPFYHRRLKGSPAENFSLKKLLEGESIVTGDETGITVYSIRDRVYTLEKGKALYDQYVKPYVERFDKAKANNDAVDLQKCCQEFPFSKDFLRNTLNEMRNTQSAVLAVALIRVGADKCYGNYKDTPEYKFGLLFSTKKDAQGFTATPDANFMREVGKVLGFPTDQTLLDEAKKHPGWKDAFEKVLKEHPATQKTTLLPILDDKTQIAALEQGAVLAATIQVTFNASSADTNYIPANAPSGVPAVPLQRQT